MSVGPLTVSQRITLMHDLRIALTRARNAGLPERDLQWALAHACRDLGTAPSASQQERVLSRRHESGGLLSR